jgi:hypothetical protein
MITPNQVTRLRTGLLDIFNKGYKVKGIEEDGSAFSVSTSISAIDNKQLQLLTGLSAETNTAIAIDRSGAKVRVELF